MMECPSDGVSRLTIGQVGAFLVRLPVLPMSVDVLSVSAP
jgi:hypothetical protein